MKNVVSKNGVWKTAPLNDTPSGKKFIVTLTLTSESGGIMDKSNAEIAEAYNAGKDIWFTGNMGGLTGTFPLKALTYVGDYDYPFIGVEFDYIDASEDTIHSTSKYMISVIASDTENYTFAMKDYLLDPDLNRFIVTLTPSASDYSGSMDHTISEIYDAFLAGKEIWFKIFVEGVGYMAERVGIGNADPEANYPSFNAHFIQNTTNTLLVAYTGYTNNENQTSYYTGVYTLNLPSASGVSF